MIRNTILISISILLISANVFCSDIKHKNSTEAMLYSSLLPGGGQFYNEKYIKSGIYLGAALSFTAGAIYENDRKHYYQDKMEAFPEYETFYRNKYEQHRDNRNLYLWLTAGTYFLNIVDAYVDAKLFNTDKEKTEKKWKFAVNRIVIYF